MMLGYGVDALEDMWKSNTLLEHMWKSNTLDVQVTYPEGVLFDKRPARFDEVSH
jgi:glucose-6-phosphate 1-dehydrogenase